MSCNLPGPTPAMEKVAGIKCSPTPDKNTIRHFRNRLTETGTLRRVMKAFDWQLQKKGFIPMSGQIVDATLMPAPKQRNTDAEKEAIKAARRRRRSGRTSRTRRYRRTLTRVGRSRSAARSGIGVMRRHCRRSPCRSLATNPTSPSTDASASSGRAR